MLVLLLAMVGQSTASPLRVSVGNNVAVSTDEPRIQELQVDTETFRDAAAALEKEEEDISPESCVDLKLNGYSGTVCGVNTTVPHSTKCLLMLPGKGDNFNSFKLFQTTASDLGYSTFSVQYFASPDTFSKCHKDFEDLDCGEQVRQCKQEGCETGTKIKVTVEQSVNQRVLEMLKFLAGKDEQQPPASIGDPAQWNTCLTGSGDSLAVNWPKIAVAGGSEGSGQAAWTGHAHSVDRVIMFSGIDDAIEYNLAKGNYSSPPWLSNGKGKTPKSKYFGFGEVYGAACRAWHLNFDTIGMGAVDWTNVNLVDPTYGYGTAHKLCSDRTKSSGGGHISTVWDRGTPKNSDGTPAYRPTWIHMLTSTSLPTAVEDAGAGNGAVGAGVDGGEVPGLPDKTEVRLSACESYKSLTQRWAFVAADKQLQLIDARNAKAPNGPALVLACKTGTCADKTVAMVTTPAKDATPPQQWELKGGQIMSTVSSMCLGQDPKPEAEAGLLTLQDCSNPTAYKFKLEGQLLKVTVEGNQACLSAKYANVTKCQCVF